MGNLSSCLKTQTTPNLKLNAKLVDSQGKLTLVNLPTTVAKIKRHYPNFALTSSEQLQQTRKMVAMEEDDWLLVRKVYLLIPVDNVGSKLSDFQVASIDEITKYIYCDETSLLGCQNLKDLMRGLCKKNVTVSSAGRISVCYLRQEEWRPRLETIWEEC